MNAFISMGENDPICSVEESKHIVSLFFERGANVKKFWGNTHEVSLEILQDARKLLDSVK